MCFFFQYCFRLLSGAEHSGQTTTCFTQWSPDYFQDLNWRRTNSLQYHWLLPVLSFTSRDYCVAANLCLLVPSPLSPSPPNPLLSGNHQFLSVSILCLTRFNFVYSFILFLRLHISVKPYEKSYFSFTDWLISLSIIPSWSVHAAAHGGILCTRSRSWSASLLWQTLLANQASSCGGKRSGDTGGTSVPKLAFYMDRNPALVQFLLSLNTLVPLPPLHGTSRVVSQGRPPHTL